MEKQETKELSQEAIDKILKYNFAVKYFYTKYVDFDFKQFKTDLIGVHGMVEDDLKMKYPNFTSVIIDGEFTGVDEVPSNTLKFYKRLSDEDKEFFKGLLNKPVEELLSSCDSFHKGVKAYVRDGVVKAIEVSKDPIYNNIKIEKVDGKIKLYMANIIEEVEDYKSILNSTVMNYIRESKHLVRHSIARRILNSIKFLRDKDKNFTFITMVIKNTRG